MILLATRTNDVGQPPRRLLIYTRPRCWAQRGIGWHGLSALSRRAFYHTAEHHGTGGAIGKRNPPAGLVLWSRLTDNRAVVWPTFGAIGFACGEARAPSPLPRQSPTTMRYTAGSLLDFFANTSAQRKRGVYSRAVARISLFVFLLAATAGAAEPTADYFCYRSFWPEFAAMRQFHEAGVDMVCLFPANTDNSLGKPYSKYPPVWRWFGKYDFASLDRQFDDVLAVNPKAVFIAMLDLNTPVWLQRQLSLAGHSAECESFTMLSCACANPAWRKATGEYVAAMVEHLEARYGDKIKAYLLAGGQTDEWMDYSRGVAGRTKIEAWKAWLKRHKRPEVPPPSLERIDRASFDNFLRDPVTEQDVVDYAQFTGDTICDAVLEFASKVRTLAAPSRKIGMFFGYILELTTTRQVWAGHLEYERLYHAPQIDFFISPGTYADRPMGGGSGFMVPNATRRLAGKGFLHEIDHRTPTYNVNLDEFVSIAWMVPWKDQAQTTAGLKREFALATVNQASLWCFDMWGGVFKTPETMQVVAKSKQIWDRFGSLPLTTRAQVALVVDPESTRYVNDRNPLVAQVHQGTRNKLNRLGAPFEVFSFNDLARADLRQYRLFVFPDLFYLTAEKKALLQKHVLCDGRTALFAYAPGVCDPNGIDTGAVRELTGATFGTPGLTTVARQGWTSVYAGRYEDMTPQALQKVASEAGVALYVADAVPVYANQRLLAIHVAEGGEKTISLPGDVRRVRELYSDAEPAVSGGRFSYRFQTPDTAVFELMP